MRFIFELDKGQTELAQQEIVALIKPKSKKAIKNLFLLDFGSIDLKNTWRRFAYTKNIYRLLFACNPKKIDVSMAKFPWQSVYKKNFAIRVDTPLGNKKIKYELEKKLAGYVWNAVNKPAVDLEKPATSIHFFFFGNIVWCGLLKYQNDDDFLKRRSHLRPKPTPISLHPKLARAMVNLTGAKDKELIIDPFCGAGGILLEAGLMGLNVEGSDISRKMIWKSMVNLKHYQIPVRLDVKDFFSINKKYKYLVADFPYGLNSAINGSMRVTHKNKATIAKELEDFYLKIIKKLEDTVKKKAVVIFPHYINYKKLLKKSKLKGKDEFEQHIHKNLTRKIVVLEQK